MARLTTEERFWKWTPRDLDYFDCWMWQGTQSKGYGKLWNGEHSASGHPRQIRAHRFSWALHFGAIPNGMHVLHKCDEPSCVNPHHLFLGSHQDNMTDSVLKGRRPRQSGEDNPAAKLTLAQVEEIRRRHKGRYGDGRRLAREFGVADSTISAVMHGQNWSAPTAASASQTELDLPLPL